jgi:hypothetical protein
LAACAALSAARAEDAPRDEPIAQPAAAQAAPAETGAAPAARGKRGRGGASAPAGMVRYDKPVYRNGRLVLFHGAWRGKGGAAPARGGEKAGEKAGEPAVAPAGVAALAPEAAKVEAAKAATLAPAQLSVALDPRLVADLAKALAPKGVVLTAADEASADLLLVWPQGGAPAQAGLAAIARLFEHEVVVIGREPAAAITDLAGKKVAVPPAGSCAGEAARTLLRMSAPNAQIVDTQGADGAALMAKGDVDAYVAVGPTPKLDGAPNGARALTTPYAAPLRRDFLPIELSKADYPRLLIGSASVDSVAIAPVLAARQSDDPARRAALQRFVEAFFSALDAGALKNPKWRDVNPAASVALARLDAAQDWIDKRRPN